MRFELDHRTGMMSPKKDDQIYFAKSQGGGLIIDDRKNNVKYIIERDERITKLFGSFDKDNLNFYDMRDARIIADRVVRLFGRDHKYTDFHYFLKGYHMAESVIRNCSDFLKESIWGDMRKRAEGEIRQENGRKLGVTEDGYPIILGADAFSDGSLVEFGDKSYLEMGDNLYVAVMNDGSTDVFYALNRNMDYKEDGHNMERCFEVDSELREEYDLYPLIALIKTINEDDNGWDDDYFFELNISMRTDMIMFEIGRNMSFRLFYDRDDAINYAVERESDIIGETGITQEDVKRWRNHFGNSFFDSDWFEDALRETYEYAYDDMDEDEAIEELLRLEIIEDTDEYFELDEDGDTDHTMPTFDYKDYGSKYVDKMMEDIGDPVDEYISQFGTEEIENHTDFDKLAELFVNADGPGNTIATYDSVERKVEIDHTTYYIYREN